MGVVCAEFVTTSMDFRLHIKGTWVLETEGEGDAMLKEPGENSRGYSIYSHNYMLLRNTTLLGHINFGCLFFITIIFLLVSPMSGCISFVCPW